VLDRLSITLRLREPWEAIDLGFALLRREWRTVYVSWFLVMAPLAAMLYLLFRHLLWLPPLLLWWIKPAADRLVLHVLAKATFGERPTVRDTLRSFSSIFKNGLGASLLWRRFSPWRSSLLPLWQLESQRGGAYRDRARILLRRGAVQGALLTLMLFILQNLVLPVATGFALEFFAPRGSGFEFWEKLFASPGERRYAVDLVASLIPFITITLLEPFYVAGGFGLYLNRRVQLEGWDLELAFRRLAQRLREGARRAVVLMFFAFLGSWSLMADAPKTEARPKAELREVLRASEFQTKKKDKVLRLKDSKKKEDPEFKPNPLQGLIHFLSRILGSGLKWVLIVSALLGVTYLLWRNRKAINSAFRRSTPYVPPEHLFGLDVRPSSLPSDVPGAAMELWKRGEARATLALLYRGALVALIHRYRVEISAGATEGDCQQAARPTLPLDVMGYFAELTQAWSRVAYASEKPENGESLCQAWASHFGPRP
jgi:hypothetical protein